MVSGTGGFIEIVLSVVLHVCPLCLCVFVSTCMYRYQDNSGELERSSEDIMHL